MDNQKDLLEQELINVDKKLQKEKSKRNIIMILLSSILCGFFLSIVIDNFDTIESILILIVISIISGSILYFISISAFFAVTDWFTDITPLRTRKNALEEKLKVMQSNTSSSNEIKVSPSVDTKTVFTNEDYQIILKCIDYSIKLSENILNRNNNELSNDEKDCFLEEIQTLNALYYIHYSREKTNFTQNQKTLSCIDEYLDFLKYELDNTVSEGRKKELLKQIDNTFLVLTKLEPFK